MMQVCTSAQVARFYALEQTNAYYPNTIVKAHTSQYHTFVTHCRSTDLRGKSVYHTNVMMAVGSGVAIVCADSVKVGRGICLYALDHMWLSKKEPSCAREDVSE